MKNIILLFILVIMFVPSIISQTDSEEDNWYLDFNEEMKAWENKKPAININYGFSNISDKDIEAAFAKNNQLGLKLGYAYKRNKYADNIEKSTFNYLQINHNSTALAGGSSSASDIESNNWQYGLVFSGGFGYKLGTESSITGYYASEFNLTNIDFADQQLSANDEYIEGRFEGSLRFGTGSEAGVRLQATNLVGLEIGYERSVVFERYLFMKWIGSEIIELAANNVLDVFIDEIFKASPDAGPIVFLVLKGALGYGINALRKGEMNWPFPSAPPILFDNLKFGVTFTF